MFDAPDGWHFSPGTYGFTLTAERIVTNEQLRDTFELTLSAADIAFLEAPGPEQCLAFMID